MVQVLPYVPGFGEKLLPVLAQAGSDVSQGVMQRNARTALQKFLTPQGSAHPQQGGSPLQQVNQAAQQSQSNVDFLPVQAMKAYNLAKEAYGPQQADILAKAYIDQQKLGAKEQQQIRSEERGIARKGSEAFFEKIGTDRLKVQDEQLASDMILDAIKSGDIDPFSQAHIGEIARAFGAPEELTKVLETPGSKEFKTARKTFIGNTIKDAFRGTTTKIEINLAEDMLAELGDSKEGNLASAWGLQASLDIRKERIRLADQLLEQGVSPSKVPSTIDKMMEPYIRETKNEYFDAIRELRKKSGK